LALSGSPWSAFRHLIVHFPQKSIRLIFTMFDAQPILSGSRRAGNNRLVETEHYCPFRVIVELSDPRRIRTLFLAFGQPGHDPDFVLAWANCLSFALCRLHVKLPRLDPLFFIRSRSSCVLEDYVDFGHLWMLCFMLSSKGSTHRLISVFS
jgi:hypothetical protein